MRKKLPGKFSMIIRSMIFFMVVPIFTIVWSMICLCTYPLPLDRRFPVVMVWTNTIPRLLKWICCIDYHIEGRENIPHDRGGVVMAKHQSSWETFYLPGQFDRTAIILKRELFWVPFFGWGMAMIRPIGINRANKNSAMKQIIEQGTQVLKDGRWVLVFPEGTRITPGQVGKYRLGGARLAVETGAPIIPVAHNAGDFWSKRTFIKRPGTVHLIYGPLIETKGLTAEEALEKTKTWIENTMIMLNEKYK